MDESAIVQYIMDTYEGVHPVDAWGDTFFFYNPDRALPDEVYFATLKSKDDEGDSDSNLNRPSIFRLNIGISKPTYQTLFGPPPSRHLAKGADDPVYDFTALDQLMPHPVYAHLFWVCVLNPSLDTFRAVQPLLTNAYDLAVGRYAKRQSAS